MFHSNYTVGCDAHKHFTSYCGLVPKLSASAGRVHYGRMVTPAPGSFWEAVQQVSEVGFSRSIPSERRDIEAANVVVMKRNHPIWRCKHVTVLSERIRRSRGQPEGVAGRCAVAVGAVARHLAEAAF